MFHCWPDWCVRHAYWVTCSYPGMSCGTRKVIISQNNYLYDKVIVFEKSDMVTLFAFLHRNSCRSLSGVLRLFTFVYSIMKAVFHVWNRETFGHMLRGYKVEKSHDTSLQDPGMGYTTCPLPNSLPPLQMTYVCTHWTLPDPTTGGPPWGAAGFMCDCVACTHSSTLLQ